MNCPNCKAPVSLFDVHCRSCDEIIPRASISSQIDAANQSQTSTDPLYEIYDVKNKRDFDVGATINGVAGAAFGSAIGIGQVFGQAAADGLAGYTPEEERAMQVYRRALKPF